jgi:hypothetical protein
MPPQPYTNQPLFISHSPALQIAPASFPRHIPFQFIFMPHEKVPALCSFTIHSILLPSHIQDPFQIAWKCGSSHGATARAVSSSDKTVIFNKRGALPLRIHCDHQTHAICSKMIRFTVYVWRQNHRQTFGKAEIDAARPFCSGSAMTETIEIESPDIAGSQALITIATIPHSTAVGAGQEALTAVVGLTEEWDISKTIDGEDTEKIQSFVGERQVRQKNYGLEKLSRGAQSIGRARSLSMPLFKRDRSKPRDGSGFELRRMASRSMGFNANRTAVKGAFRAVLSNTWLRGRGDFLEGLGAMPVAVRAVLECCRTVRLFDAGVHAIEGSRDIVDELVAGLEETDVMKNGGFLLSLWLLHGLRQVHEEEHERAEYCIEKVAVIARRQLDDFVGPAVDLLMPIGEEMLDGDGNMEVCTKLCQKVAGSFGSFCFPDVLNELCVERLVALFDEKMVGLIPAVPGRCTVGHAIHWNTMITICELNGRVTLPLFRAATWVVQSATALCEQPSIVEEMALELPPAVVLQLLQAIVPDEFCPRALETRQFAGHFKIDPEGKVILHFPYKGTFDGTDKVLSHEWDREKFSWLEIPGCEFLADFVL